MAHQLGIKVVAEGIETKTQKVILVASGCEYGQGYYFSKSLDGSDFLYFHND
jgi:sensor c-di-GMP phosphodiesterase-like protein